MNSKVCKQFAQNVEWTKTRQVCCNIPSCWIPPLKSPTYFPEDFSLEKMPPLLHIFSKYFPRIFPQDIWSNMFVPLCEILEPLSQIYFAIINIYFKCHFDSIIWLGRNQPFKFQLFVFQMHLIIMSTLLIRFDLSEQCFWPSISIELKVIADTWMG